MLPYIETDRLLLRNISLEDASDMYEYAKKPDVGPRAGWPPHKSIEETKVVIGLFKANAQRTGLGVFSIILKDSGKMIGTIEIYNRVGNYKAELGYCLNPDYWGQGYTVEASKAILKWAFEYLHLKRVQVGLFPDNRQSERVCQKLQMFYEGLLHKSYLLFDGTIKDEKIYSMTDDLYFKLKEEEDE